MTIFVRSLRDKQRPFKLSENEFRVDRSVPLGNHDYKIGRDGDRRTVIEKYRRWLEEELKSPDRMKSHLAAFDMLVKEAKKGDIILLCWCWPLPCHADVIKEFIERELQ